MKQIFLKSFCARCLTLLILALLSTNLAWGTDVLITNLTFPDNNKDNNKVSDYTSTWTAQNAYGSWTIENFNNNKWDNWTYIRAGRKNNESVAHITSPKISDAVNKVKISIDAVTFAKINSVTLYSGTSSDEINTNEGTFTVATGEQTVSISNPQANRFYKVTFDCASGSSNGLIQISKVALYKAEVTPANKVPTPTISPNGGEFVGSQVVTLTCENDDASIYYTTNGETPTNSSTLYTAPFIVEDDCIVKAIAVKSEMDDSNVASAEFKKVTPLTTMDAIFSASATKGDYWITFNNWVVSGVKGDNAYITDNAGKGLIVYKSGHGFEVGDILSGTVKCALTKYNGSAEITNLTSTTEGLTVTKNGTVNPVDATISELSGVNTGAYINLGELTYNGTEFTDGTNTIKPYNTFITLPNLTEGIKYNVKGVYIQFNNTKEIAPTKAEDFEKVAATEYNITVTPCENGSVTVDAGNNKAQAGQVIKLTVSPNNGYKLATLTVKDAAEGDVTVTNNKFTMPASNVTISATFAEKAKHNVKFYSLGTELESQEIYDSECIANTPTATQLTGWTFTGWTVNSEYAMSTTSPELFDLETPITEAINLYAVYSKTEGVGGSYTLNYDPDVNNKTLGYGSAVDVTAADGSKWVVKAYKNSGMQINTGKNSSIKIPECPVNISSIEITCSAEKAVGLSADDYNGSGNITYIIEGTDAKSQTLDCSSKTVTGGYIVPKSGSTSITKIVVNYGHSTTTYTITAPRTFQKTISDRKMATLYLDYAVEIPENVKAYTAKDKDDSHTAITLEKVTDGVIPAHTGVIVYADVEESTNFDFVETATTKTYSDNCLKGVTAKTVFNAVADYDDTANNYYALMADEGTSVVFKLVSGGSYAANSAYLVLPKTGAAKIDITFGEPTGIEEVQNSRFKVQGSVYNLNGLKVNENYEGIIIVNGKKYINK